MADLKRRIIAEFSAKNKAKGEMAGFRRDMDTTGKAMKRMATSALAAAGLGGGIYALKRVFDYVTQAAMKQEDALFLLSAALKTSGEYSYGTMKGFEAFASSIQQATVYGDEEVISLMQLMKSLGVTSNKLEQATRMAIGLAAATGRDVRSMSMYIALAQQGEFTMLRRYIPALRATTDATEQLQIITEFAAAGFEIAKAKAETASGAIQQMKNAYGDVAEVIGDSFLPSMKIMSIRQKEFLEKNKAGLRNYLTLVAEGAEMMDWLNRKMLSYLPPVLIYKALTKPEEQEKVLPPAVGGIVRFEEPDWLKETLALNEMTEAQKKAAASMYEMSMKARGLSKELAREKKITQFAALAKVRYAADVEGAQAAEERFVRALEKTEQLQIAVAIEEKKRADALAIAHKQMELDMEREEEMIRSWEQTFENALDRLGQNWKNYGEIAKQVLREIFRETLRITLYRPAAQALADWIPGALFGAAGAIFGGGGMPTAGTVPASSGAMMARYQHGGVATRPHLAVVGEVPEAFVPLSGGRIPVEMRGGRGAGSFDVHIHNEGQEKLEISQAEQYWAGDQRVIDIFMTRSQTDGGLRRAIKEAAK